MWGVQSGEIELGHGDILLSERLTALNPQADVLLINNFIFGAERK